jgi:phospholipase/carboxylesterase
VSPPGLVVAERPPRAGAGGAGGLLVLHHGRGADEQDLLTLADVLDPGGELYVVTPRAPLQLGPAPGFHWYLVPRVGTPDPDTFHSAYVKLAALHDELWERTGVGPERTILGGFSMGSVMSYALGLAPDRPRPAGILAFSGFLPTVPGWEVDLDSRRGMPVLIEHGRRDAIIDVAFARVAEQRLRDAGLAVTYRESEAGHHIDPRELPVAQTWVHDTLAAAPAAEA